MKRDNMTMPPGISINEINREAALVTLARMKEKEHRLQAAGKLHRFKVRNCIINACGRFVEQLKRYDFEKII